MKPSQFTFFQRFLKGFFESMYVHGFIDSVTPTRLSNWCQTAEAKGYARTADFCVFDNRATRGKPNVYIEAGMCIALKKPFILFDHKPASRNPNAPGPIPSDLAYALALPYRTYRQLFRDFYFRLPLFFQKHVH